MTAPIPFPASQMLAICLLTYWFLQCWLVDLRVFSILGECSTTEMHPQPSLYPCFISITSGLQKFLGNGVMAHVNRVVSLLHSELFPGDPTELACAPRGSRLDSSSLCTHTTVHSRSTLCRTFAHRYRNRTKAPANTWVQVFMWT